MYFSYIFIYKQREKNHNINICTQDIYKIFESLCIKERIDLILNKVNLESGKSISFEEFLKICLFYEENTN